MNDWNLWLNSSETRVAIKLLEEKTKELQESIAGGFLLQHGSADKIAVDYAHKVGVLEGLNSAVSFIKNIKEEIDENYLDSSDID